MGRQRVHPHVFCTDAVRWDVRRPGHRPARLRHRHGPVRPGLRRAAGIAPSLPVLVASRIAQGIGAAFITPTSLALIREAFHDPAARGRAIAYWALGGSIAAAAGPVLGGLLTQVDWRLIFFVNVPVGASALALLTQVAPSTPRLSRFDWTGQAAAVTALAALTYGVIEGGSRGFRAASVVLSLALAVAAGAIFVTAQARGKNPMLPPDLFRSRAVPVVLVVAAVTLGSFYGVVFLQSLYFQQQRGLSALITGLLFLPMTGMVAVLNPLVARLMQPHNRVALLITGQSIMAAGLLTLALAPASAPTLLVALLMIPVGVGGSLTVPPVTAIIMDRASSERAGTAGGILNTARQMGGSLSVAVFGAVLAQNASFTTGLRVDLVAAAVLLLALAIVTTRLRLRSGQASSLTAGS